jgi:ATP-dependent protease ClpP protease subunit
MNDQRKKKIELERLALNLEYSFNRGVDLENRIIRLTEDIEEHHFDWFDSALTALEAENRKRVTLRISSYGGDVYSALGIIGRMRNSKCLIDTEGYGKIMSASTAILAAGHKRSMSSLAEFMHHESSYSVEGRHSEIQHEVNYSQKLSVRTYTVRR